MSDIGYEKLIPLTLFQVVIPPTPQEYEKGLFMEYGIKTSEKDYLLSEGKYLFVSEQKIEIKKGEIGLVIGIDNLILTGNEITTRLLEEGFKGRVATIVNYHTSTKVKKGLTFAKMIILKKCQ